MSAKRVGAYISTRGFGVKGLPGAVLAPGAMELSIAKHAPMLGKALKGCNGEVGRATRA